MRVALGATAVANLAVAGSVFLLPGDGVRQMVGLPPVGHPFDAATAGMFVGLFGVAYGWVAVTARDERLFLALAAIGKTAFVGLVLGLWIAGRLPDRAPLLASGDLVFAGLFLHWLRTTA
jgi:hypothetical protein